MDFIFLLKYAVNCDFILYFWKGGKSLWKEFKFFTPAFNISEIQLIPQVFTFAV